MVVESIPPHLPVASRLMDERTERTGRYTVCNSTVPVMTVRSRIGTCRTTTPVVLRVLLIGWSRFNDSTVTDI